MPSGVRLPRRPIRMQILLPIKSSPNLSNDLGHPTGWDPFITRFRREPFPPVGDVVGGGFGTHSPKTLLCLASSSAPSRGLARDLVPSLASALAALEAFPAPEVAVGAIVAVAAHGSAVLAPVNTLSVCAPLSVSCSSLATHISYSCYWIGLRC